MVTASQRLQNAWKVLAGTDTLLTHPLRGMRRAVQAFYKRFSGQERAQVSDRQGADARRDATSGQFACFQCPGAGALDDCHRIAAKLNTRPRKRLGYRTPEECYAR